MKKTLVALVAFLGLASMANADLSESQEYLRRNNGTNYSNGTDYEVHWNDMQNSQTELRRSGPAQRHAYVSCRDANFGSEYWWECRRDYLNGR